MGVHLALGAIIQHRGCQINTLSANTTHNSTQQRLNQYLQDSQTTVFAKSTRCVLTEHRSANLTLSVNTAGNKSTQRLGTREVKP